MLHGDFGISYTYRVPVGELIAQRIGVSAPLAIYALALTLLVAVPGRRAVGRTAQFHRPMSR